MDAKEIVQQILSDHVIIETYLRAMRDRTSNRADLLATFSNFFVAHSSAEEEGNVYARIREAAKSVGEDKKEQKPDAEVQHTKALLHLLALQECDVSNVTTWETALESLIIPIVIHSGEEEMTLLNVARIDMTEQQRADLGAVFAQTKAKLMAENCGSIDNVKRLVKERATMVQQLKQAVLG